MWLMPSAKRRPVVMGPGVRWDDERLWSVTSRVAAVLAEQIQLLLHRTVGETEQHGILIRLVGDPLPARHHEQVARAPLKSLVADPCAALALDRGKYRGVGRTIAGSLETLRQQLDEGSDRRHRKIAGLG